MAEELVKTITVSIPNSSFAELETFLAQNGGIVVNGKCQLGNCMITHRQ